jgi:anti-anti-sigma factor
VANAPLQIELAEPAAGVSLFAVSGAILLGPESECIERCIRDGLDSGRRLFLFDLTNVKKIDSTGIGRFISAYNLILKANAELRIVCVPGMVLKSFQATRLDTVFRIFASIPEALGSLPQ